MNKDNVGDALPPLPSDKLATTYTADQMHDYARAAIASTKAEAVASVVAAGVAVQTELEARAAPVEDEIPLKARIFKRESTSGWVLELEGTANGTFFINRHTEPLSTPLEDVAGLPSLYAQPSAAPVAEVYECRVNGDSDVVWLDEPPPAGTKLYTAPIPAQPSAEQVASEAAVRDAALVAEVRAHLIGVVRSFGEKACADYIETWHQPDRIIAAIQQSQQAGKEGA